MLQDLIAITIAPERLKAIDAALTALEAQLDDFIELSVEQRRELVKLGPRSEVFCRETLSVMERSPGALPADFPMDSVRQDREALDQVRPILSRLRMLVGLAQDTEMALGSDVYKAALEGYRFARVGGKGALLDELKAQANPRFGNQGRRRKPGNDTGTGTGDPA